MQVTADVDYTGRTVDHYAILALIRGGAQGRVYRGRDEVLHRDVAIKVLHKDCPLNAGSRRDLIAEARALSRLSHPNVAGVYDFVTDEDRQFMVMELVAGPTLEDILAGGPLPVTEVVRLGAQLARGLAAAHAAGIAHCDIKPANLKITSSGVLKIVDFGVARRLDPELLLADVPTTAGEIVGTLPYMAPEVLQGERPGDQSDIFSAGAVLFEMATGTRAFPQTTLPALVRAIQEHDVAVPSTVNPALPVALDRIVLRALESRRDQRYQSAGELAANLDDLPIRIRDSRLSTPRASVSWRRLATATCRWLVPLRRDALCAGHAAPSKPK